jgi:dihydroorotate dehydrogenase electron transfer subunit
MMKLSEHCTITSNSEIAKGIFDMRIETGITAKPGQFVNVFTMAGEHILPRPISVCETAADGALRLVYRVAGKGTCRISRLRGGDKVKVIGALGNGYDAGMFGGGAVAAAGGGIGAPPLLGLVKMLRAHDAKREIHAFLGFRSETFLVNEFEEHCTVHIATDDGSNGFWGTAVDDLKNSCIKIETAAVCGPKPMLAAAAKWAEAVGAKLFVSTEERMACGVGACVGCVIKIKKGNDFEYKKVCVDGPVFDSAEVIW